jgi:hypothetical protein
MRCRKDIGRENSYQYCYQNSYQNSYRKALQFKELRFSKFFS